METGGGKIQSLRSPRLTKRLNYRGNYRDGKECYRSSRDTRLPWTCLNGFHISPSSITNRLAIALTRLMARAALLNDRHNESDRQERCVWHGTKKKKKYFITLSEIIIYFCPSEITRVNLFHKWRINVHTYVFCIFNCYLCRNKICLRVVKDSAW